MKKFYKKIAIVAAAVLLLASLSGCGAYAVGSAYIIGQLSDAQNNHTPEATTTAPSEYDTTTSETTSGAEAPEATKEEGSSAEAETTVPGSSSQDNKLLPTYVHYDPSTFIADCEKLEEYAKDGKTDEVLTLYDELYEEAIRVQDICYLAELRSYENASDKKWQEENEYMNDVNLECVDRLSLAGKNILESKCAKDFEEHLDDDYLIEYYETYEEASDRAKELKNEETKLENEYNSIMDNLNEITCEIDGTTYKFDELLDYQNNELYSEDYPTFMEAFNKCYKELNTRCGEVFVKLVKVRDEMAKEYGYDNFNDYADERLYGRDYSARDLEKMKAAVREFGGEYQSYYYSLYDMLPKYDGTFENVVKDGKSFIEGISPLSDKALKYIEENELYSIGPEENRVNAGFTTTFEENHIPYIFIKTSDTPLDVITYTHEFGHFTESYWNSNPYPLYAPGSYDLFEIHSTGLQLLASANYGNVFGNDAMTLEAFNAINLLTYVGDGCLYDEWQREIYENPDMTLDEINKLFYEVNEDYGLPYYEGQEYSWVEINHNFSSPLYYVSYATSAFASLQIWLKSLTDYSGAISIWENIVGAGAYDEGYMDVVSNAGLKTFDNKQDVSNVLNEVYQNALLGIYASN